MATLIAAACLALCASSANADLIGLDGSGNLWTISTSDASLSLIGSTGLVGGSLHYRASNGQLYSFTLGRSARLYSINPGTAVSTAVGSGLGVGFVFEGGLTELNGTAYATNQGNSTTAGLMTVDLDAGTASLVGALADGQPTADFNGLLARGDGKLIGLDRVGNNLQVIDPAVPQVTSVLGTIPTSNGVVGGLAWEDGISYAITEGGMLYSFDMFSGTTSLIGNTDRIDWRGIAGTAMGGDAPEPGALALVALATLLGLRRRRRRRRAAL